MNLFLLISPAVSQCFQIGFNGGIEPGGFGLLLAQRRGEALHLLLERLTVILGGLRADVAAGREHVAVFTDFFELRGFAETGDVFVNSTLTLALSLRERGFDVALSPWGRGDLVEPSS